MMRKYAYYFCHTKGCTSYRKSISRDKIEAEFERLLRRLVPTQSLFRITRRMFEAAWNQRKAQGAAIKRVLRDDIARIDGQIEELLDRIVDAAGDTLIRAYEKRLSALEAEKLSKKEKMSAEGNPTSTFEEMFEHAFTFLSNPFRLWESGHLENRRAVLKLAFSERLAYCRKKGFRTPELSLPFKALRSICRRDFQMVRSDGLESNTLFETFSDWEEQLKILREGVLTIPRIPETEGFPSEEESVRCRA